MNIFKIFSTNRLATVLVSFLTTAQFVTAESTGEWNGKQAAVVLTYDDALESHLSVVVPQLDANTLRATFYVPVGYDRFQENITRWEQVALSGHELGNHTLFHPCDGGYPDREWVSPDYDLSTYSRKRIVDEILVANIVLQSIDHNGPRTFAYTCGEKEAGGESFRSEIEEQFVGARGVEGKLESIDEIDLYDIGSYVIKGNSGREMIDLVDQAIRERALIVFLFHGVGGDHSIDVDVEHHEALIQYISMRKDELWIAPLRDIATYIRDQQSHNHE